MLDRAQTGQDPVPSTARCPDRQAADGDKVHIDRVPNHKVPIDRVHTGTVQTHRLQTDKVQTETLQKDRSQRCYPVGAG